MNKLAFGFTLALLGVVLTACNIGGSKLNAKDQEALAIGRLISYNLSDYKSLSDSEKKDFMTQTAGYFANNGADKGFITKEMTTKYADFIQKRYQECINNATPSQEKANMGQLIGPCQASGNDDFFRQEKLPRFPARVYQKFTDTEKQAFVRQLSFSAAQKLAMENKIGKTDISAFTQASGPIIEACLSRGLDKDATADVEKVSLACQSPESLASVIQQVKALSKQNHKGKGKH